MVRIARFLKFMRKRAHAEDFVAGRLYLNASAYFRECKRADDGRRDEHEGRVRFAPESLSSIDDGDLDFAPSELGERLFAQDQAKLLCLAMLRAEELAPERLTPLMHDWSRLGQFAVAVLRPREFLQKLLAAVERSGLQAEHGPIRYADEQKDHPLFTKHSSYAWQREYRLAIHGARDGHLRLDVGSLADLCVLIEAK